MSLEITGKLVDPGTTIVVSEKFKKREFVLELAEEINGNVYTNFAKMQLVQAKCDILNGYRPGEMVKVNFNIKGNSFVDKKDGTTKYITNLDAWRIERTGQQQAQQQQGYQPAQQQYAPPPIQQNNQWSAPDSIVDDLPF